MLPCENDGLPLYSVWSSPLIIWPSAALKFSWSNYPSRTGVLISEVPGLLRSWPMIGPQLPLLGHCWCRTQGDILSRNTAETNFPKLCTIAYWAPPENINRIYVFTNIDLWALKSPKVYAHFVVLVLPHRAGFIVYGHKTQLNLILSQNPPFFFYRLEYEPNFFAPSCNINAISRSDQNKKGWYGRIL